MTGLQKQVIPVDFDLGMDTKTDPKKLVPGSLLLLENAVKKKRNRIQKRPGNFRIPNVGITGSAIANPESLAVFNDELLQYAGQRLYSYSEGASKWIDKGAVVSAIVTTGTVVKNTATQTQVDSATNRGVSVYAWEDSRGGVYASVYDAASGTALLADVSLDASASRARCLAFDAYLYVFYYKSGSLYVRRINPASPTAFDSAVVVSTTVNTTNPTYDVVAYGNIRIFFGHNVQGSAAMLFGWLNEVPAIYTGVLAAFQVAEAATNSLSIILNGNLFYIGFHNATNGVRATVLNNGGGTVQAPFTVEAITASTVVNLTGYVISGTTSVQFLYEKTGSTAQNQLVRQNRVNADGTVGTASDFQRSVGLWSKAWTYVDSNGASNSFVAVTRDSTFQSTFFVIRSDGLIVAKQQYALGSGLTSRPILQNVWTAATGIYSYALLTKNQIVSENATIFTPTGVSKTSLDFTNQEIFTAAQLGNNLHIVGGVLSMYDGLSVVEHGFHLYPEVLSASTSGATGVGAGTYQYVALYEWTDNYGQIHRSAPSVAITVPVVGTKNVSVVIDTLRLTAKKDTRTNVSVVLYRTEDVGAVFYRVSSILSPSFNVPTSDSITIVDVTPDASLVGNEILYTVGGALDNIGAPASSTITVYKNRLFLAGLEDPNDSWFSKEHKVGVPVEFSNELTKSVEPTGGGVTALFVIDDKLLYFKEDRYYFTYGDGPNDTGQGGDFAEPQFKTADVGCTNASSISRFPDGIMLKTNKGIYKIDANLNPDYIGAPVEDYNNEVISSAVLIPDNNQVRFTTAAGPALVYDYYFQQWSIFTNQQAQDAVLWQGSYVLLKANGLIWQEDKTLSKDDGASIKVRIITGWLAFASVVGFQRVYRYALLGEYKSPHKLRVSVGYDFSEAYNQTRMFDPDEALGITRYGDVSPYGSEPTFGGANIAYRYTCQLKIQKCQALRFMIEEVIASSTAGSQESFNLSTLGLVVGLKAGLGKLKRSQNLGMG